MAEATQCPHASDCELYPRFSLKGALKIWQQRYCNSAAHHRTCVRFQLASQGQPVPATLLPNGERIPT
jgi:hypothetical protein